MASQTGGTTPATLSTGTATAAGSTGTSNAWAVTNGGNAPVYGVNMHALRPYESDYANQFKQFASIGTKWIRTDVTWDAIDPGENGQYDQGALTQLDQVVAAARNNNLNMLLVTLDGNVNNATGYGNFLKFLGNRYQAPANSPVVAYEIWNEANINGVSAASYAAIANAGCAGVKASASKATSPVVWGAIANTGDWQTWTDQALGASNCLDAVSIHPYVVGNDVATLHQMMVAHGDGSKPVWYTEFGPSTFDVSEQQQSANVISTIAQAKSSFPYVTVAMQYEDRDEPSVSPASEQHYGVFNADSSGRATAPKAVFASLRSYYASAPVSTALPAATPTLPMMVPMVVAPPTSSVAPGRLTAPLNVQVTMSTGGGVQLSWDAVPGAIGYVVQLKKGGPNGMQVDAPTNVSGPAADFNGLEAMMNYTALIWPSSVLISGDPGSNQPHTEFGFTA